MSIQPMKAGRRVFGAATVAAAMLGTAVVAQADAFDRQGFRGEPEIVDVRGGYDRYDDDRRGHGRRHGWGHHRHHDHWGHHHGGHHRHHHHGGHRPYRGW
ncbi:MAG TPA: hypothetical protein VF641_00240 [Methylobacterium sp.]|jgi:hypothetical protein